MLTRARRAGRTNVFTKAVRRGVLGDVTVQPSPLRVLPGEGCANMDLVSFVTCAFEGDGGG